MACSKALGFDRGRDGRVGAAEALDRSDRILLADVHEMVGPELAGRFQAVGVHVHRDHGGAR